MSFFIHSIEAIPGSTATATLFCIKTPKVFQDRVIEILNTKGKDAPPEPLAFLQSAVVQVTTELYDKSIWTLRNHIRAIEKVRNTPTIPRQTKTSCVPESAG